MSDDKTQIARNIEYISANDDVKSFTTIGELPHTRRKTMTLSTVKLSQIIANSATELRKGRRDEDFQKNHLKEGGLFAPPVIVQQPDGLYRIVAGNRTVKVAKLLKWDTIPVYLINSEPTGDGCQFGKRRKVFV